MIVDFATDPLLVFKSTGNKVHHGHVTDTRCRPDITAAFEGYWREDSTTLWPCIQFAGEDASKGKSKAAHKEHAISYLHYLLLARPDLHVAQGVLISEKRIMFLLGIGGVGTRKLSLTWHNKDLYKLMYAFVYRLYRPAQFKDSSYLKIDPNLQQKFVTYTIRLENGIECAGFYPIYATNPFQTRTHILSNPQSDIKVEGKVLTVLKDQLCRSEARFEENEILALVHHPEIVPGVVEAVCHELVKIPESLGVSRIKHRMGLRQAGSPITSIPTLKGMLEVAFDVLEGTVISIYNVLFAHMFVVLRYLRVNRQILHRDISKGNVLYIEEETTRLPDDVSVGPDEKEAKELPLCFIKYLLRERHVEIGPGWDITNVRLNIALTLRKRRHF